MNNVLSISKLPKAKTAKPTVKNKAVSGLTRSKEFIIYDMNPFDLNDLGFNRGMGDNEDQFKKQRVESIKNKMMARIWQWGFGFLQAFEYKGKHQILDGHHRLQAVKELIAEGFYPTNYQIPVLVLDDPEIKSMNKKELARLISVINDYDARWSEKEHVDTAIIFDLEAAQALQRYKTQFDNLGLKKLNDRKLNAKYNWIYALAIKDYKFASEHRKVTFDSLMDNNIGRTMSTNEFKENFNGLVTLIKNHGILWEEHIRLSAVISYFIEFGLSIGFKKLNSVLLGKKPKSEKDVANFFINIYRKHRGNR